VDYDLKGILAEMKNRMGEQGVARPGMNFGGQSIPRLSLEGGGGLGNGILSGGGTASLPLDVGALQQLILRAGGGGAYGQVGGQKIREFSPYLGIDYRMQF
jgi:hypothetical protein